MNLLRILLLLPVAVRQSIAYTTLTDSSLQSIPEPGSDFDIKNADGLLAPILVPRVPGTPGSQQVRDFFAGYFSQTLPHWKLAWQNSTSTTPTSNGAEVPFSNLIATLDPPWVEQDGEVGRLTLVAHYDSKLTPAGFIGAVDSAAPCAMLLHVARSIDKALTEKWAAMEAEGLGSGGFEGIEEHKGVQILLLDGEEAFATWTHTDSIYGARALAEEWESTMNQAGSTYRNKLSGIDLFVLLDLLGSANPRVPSYYKTTHWAYQSMASVETRLRNVGKLKSKPVQPFLPEANKKDNQPWLGGYIEDDHLPFISRGVEILHIIPSPFPSVWHKMEDDGEHLDIPSTEDWAMIVTAFAAEWMDLEGFLSPNQATKARTMERHYGEEEKSELQDYPTMKE